MFVDFETIAANFRLVNMQLSSEGSVLGSGFSLGKSEIEMFGDLRPSAGLMPMLTGLL